MICLGWSTRPSEWRRKDNGWSIRFGPFSCFEFSSASGIAFRNVQKCTTPMTLGPEQGTERIAYQHVDLASIVTGYAQFQGTCVRRKCVVCNPGSVC